MTKRDILSVALKILGIISVMYAVEYINGIGMGLGMIFQQPGPGQNFNPYWFLGSMTLTAFLSIAIAYILLRWGDLIAQKLVRDDSAILALGSSQWERPIFMLSLRIIGVVCLIKGIPELVRVLSELSFRSKYQGIIRLSDIGPSIIGAIVFLIIGVYLISGGKHLVEFAYGEKNGNTR